MPGTTRYSATFDRTYEEEDRVDLSPPPNARRSRSQSLQANSGLNGGRPYTPLGGRPPNQRSSSTDNGPENIPTRTVGKTAVKAHNNPFQFVKVGMCPLYKKAAEQLQKAKEVKKPDVLKEEEEEWQSNLDSWKSRRRKMSEDVFRRAEEVRQFELEEQESLQASQKKIKTFSEMVEQRATRGRALSLCLISSPMDMTSWEFEGSHKNGSCSTFSGESEENSNVNSEDEGVSLKGISDKSENNNHRTNGDSHIEKNGDYDKLSDLTENNLQMKPKEGSYIDSGLESISSHRAGDTPDSGSDFSHDSGSSIDCDSPRTGVNILEEFSTKSSQISPGQVATNGTTNGFNICEKKPESTVTVNTSKSEVPSPKTKSLQYEKSIESENEMFVDDYEDLQRQSDLLASSRKSETHAQANGNIRPTSIEGVIPNITLSKTASTSKQKSNIPNGSVEGFIKTETNNELGGVNEKNGDATVKTRTRRKGVYSLNVSAAPNQISKDGNSVNSLFPLSPVTELPSPEDAKTMAATLSSKLTTVTDSEKGKIFKELAKEAGVDPSPNVKGKLKPATVATEAVNSKNISSDDPKIISPKVEVKTDLVASPSSPSVESKGKNAIPVSPQNEKPKLILKKVVKIKLKKATPTENQITKEVSTSSSLPSQVDASVKNVEKDKPIKEIKELKSVSQNEEKQSNEIKTESKQQESSKIMESLPANTVAETDGSKNIPSSDLKITSKDIKKTDSIPTASTETAINKGTTTMGESPQAEIPKPILGPKKVKIKIKKATPTENQITKDVSKSSSLPTPVDACVTNVDKDKPIKEFKLVSQNEEKQSNKIKTESKQQESSKITESTPTNSVSKTDGFKNVPPNDLKINFKDVKKTDSITIASTETTINKETTTLGENPQAETPKPTLAPKKLKIKIKKANTSENASSSPTKLNKEALASSSTNTSLDLSQNLPNKSTTEIKSSKTSEDKKVTVTKECKNTEPSMESKITSTVAGKTTTESKLLTPTTPTNSTSSISLKPTVNGDRNIKPAPNNIKDKLSQSPSSSVPDSKESKIPNTTTSTTTSQDKAKPSIAPKKTISKPKNANSQKVNTPAKQIEECKKINVESLNVVFQTQPKNSKSENQCNTKKSEIVTSVKANIDLVSDVPPVEKVAEEMEKLILEQLEEEERAKELASGLQIKSPVDSPEHFLTAPPKLAEPPKEKPPPPPSTNEGNQKDTPLKRVNSTKRIKKEIYKRRSNFLGIDNADESLACNESSIPPPPALEEILKAEMELDRQSRLKIENESTERLTQEENEIMQKEREIIESLESEERQQLVNCTEDFSDVTPNSVSDVISEEERILLLKNERKRLEAERLMAEEQQLHLMEEKQLREREEFILKQEAGKSAVPLSVVSANVPNTSQPPSPSLSTNTQTSVSLSGAIGDGNNLTSLSAPELSKKSSESGDKEKVPQRPAVPPKPFKKKEAIRKERERLRQEQETLQREREEHRRKLIQEQEEILKQQKSHAPEAPVASRLGPLPPLVPPSLTTTPHARDSASFPSRSHHGAPNGAAGSNNAAELMGPAVARQKMPPPRKSPQNESWGQQKISSVRKQNQDSLTESRYNQNHWLIQEAEMRRIADLKERQRATQPPCSQTHLAEDDVCSNPPRVPVIPPTHNNQHLNYHTVQDKMWNYASQQSVPVKKYTAPVVAKEPLHTIYPRETVSQQPPVKPSRVVPMERQEQMLSVSGRKRCSHCSEELGRGAAMIIESLQLYYHINCFQCCVCHAQLGNGSCGADVRVRNQKLHCHNCYSNDEAGLKFSQV